MLNRNATVLLTGATGMVGGATLKLLSSEGFANALAPARSELDLRDLGAVNRFFEKHQPHYVLMVAAKVGGIAANIQDPVGFIEENLQIALNLFSACYRYKTKKNLFLGSSCIYPAGHSEPIPESSLMTGRLEPTNEGYALSKIVGLKLAQYYRQQYGLLTVCPMFCNVYGTGDHFDLQKAHVLSSLVRRFVDARDNGASSVTLWGSGIARREFLHADDAARAILFFMDHIETSDHLNVGPGVDVTIKELATIIAGEAGYRGQIAWDPTKPDGMLRKCLDVSKLQKLGFRTEVTLVSGIRRTVKEYEGLKASGAIQQ